jgi:Transcriptional regulator, AbiEi antitoxin
MSEAWRESEPEVRLDATLAAAAASQHGVFSLAQLNALGLGTRAVQKRATCGRLHRIHRGVYAVTPPSLLTREAHFIAAVLAAGPGAVLSHRSAALLHGLLAVGRFSIDVTGRTHRHSKGIDVHRSTTLTERDVTAVDGIRCTNVARTLLDLADVITPPQLELAVNKAEAKSRLHLRALEDQLGRNHTRPAAHRLRAALDIYRPGHAPPASRLEQDFLALIRAAGLPDGDPPIRVDFMWRERKAVLETDGHEFHRTRQAFEHDRIRDQRLMRARWRFARVTWRQLRDDPDTVIAVVIDLLAD